MNAQPGGSTSPSSTNPPPSEKPRPWPARRAASRLLRAALPILLVLLVVAGATHIDLEQRRRLAEADARIRALKEDVRRIEEADPEGFRAVGKYKWDLRQLKDRLGRIEALRTRGTSTRIVLDRLREMRDFGAYPLAAVRGAPGRVPTIDIDSISARDEGVYINGFAKDAVSLSRYVERTCGDPCLATCDVKYSRMAAREGRRFPLEFLVFVEGRPGECQAGEAPG